MDVGHYEMSNDAMRLEKQEMKMKMIMTYNHILLMLRIVKDELPDSQTRWLEPCDWRCACLRSGKVYQAALRPPLTGGDPPSVYNYANPSAFHRRLCVTFFAFPVPPSFRAM